MSKARSRQFCVTGWEDNLDALKSEAEVAEYAIIGKEFCPTTGKLHYQCFFRFACQRMWSAVKKRLKGCNVDIAKGHELQASDYCFKDEDIVLERGHRTSQGQRTDLLVLRDQVKAGTRVDDIAVENPVAYHQYGRTLSKIEDILMRKKFRTEMTAGIWFIGETGAGKSHKAFEGYSPETHYVWPYDKGDWCDGYIQQENFVINEFRGQIAYSRLLELVDKWPCFLSRRGREPMPFLSKCVIVTSKMHPRDVYKNLSEHDTLDQLLRRFKIFRVAKDFFGEYTYIEE